MNNIADDISRAYQDGYNEGYNDGYQAGEYGAIRHGRWIEFPEVLALDDTLENGYIGCSVCKDVWNMRDNDTERYDYCPNCGARMDGSKNV